jgi:hypothetical protein
MATRRVSKHGLSGCPSCGNHVKLEAVWRETVCPFCNALITKPGKLRAFPGRGGLLAASLLSVGLIGCDKDPDPSPDAGMGGAGGVGGAGGAGGAGGKAGAGGMDPQPAPEPAVQPLYGEPAPMPAPEPAPMPEYGEPPMGGAGGVGGEPMGGMGGGGEPEPAPEGGAVPEYGIPPMPDAGVQMDMAVAPDAGIMPEYGAPPVEPDAGTSDASPDADPEPAPAPLYGIPPEGE